MSKQANNKKEFRQAYDLWFEGGGNPKDPYITKIRDNLIEEEIIKDNDPSTYFLHNADLIGKSLTYSALMEKGTSTAINEAYELGIDSEHTQKAREAMVNINPSRALKNFIGYDKEKIEDPRGDEYVLEFISKKYEVNKGLLKNLLENTE